MAELTSNAETFADESRNLSAFKGFSLPGVKEKVATILSMIGRVEGIFSTYTIHDISHVEAMLNMLDWLVPPSTQEVMTPVDWLMTVLAIYLHDLGMVVTAEEYDQRMENRAFCEFLNSLQADPSAKDYLARTESIGSEEERARFFYQEFIRKQHAARIREWITGRHSSHWGDKVKPVADEIAKMLGGLPPRFKEHLATICESHHKDNLDKSEYFPLYQHYGGPPEAAANVQYAALLLRTTDLLHVTKDRTPSIMYKTIRLSDPKGVDEWKKQMGTFSVYMVSRKFDPDDPDTHVIVVSADFTEERPFFALTEYLAYANDQTLQSKRWADISQKTRDAEDYSFPWHSVKGSILVEGNEPFPMKFELDRGRLLDLLVGHTIYNDPTVAVRELLQNAIDAVRYQHYLDKQVADRTGHPEPPMGRVLVRWDPEERELVVEDNGIGMDRDVILFHLMRVGASFYDTPQFQAEYADFTPISRFGIGILTCFMVSDDIEIVTCRQAGGYRIKLSSVHADYLLKELEAGNPVLEGLEPHGTRVRLKIRKSVKLEERGMLDIVRHWIVLPVCQVLFCRKGKEAQCIGFKSPEEALRYYHLSDLSKRQAMVKIARRYSRDLGWPELKGEISYEVVDTSCERNGQTYELAYAVRKGFTPERSVLGSPNPDAPAVCVEGIRADEHLPGFRAGLCALLSVGGNRAFRTTVSRTSLERDAEYDRVAGICAELLFTHVEGEVKRIAAKKGSPLSQASTGGQWVYESVLSHASEQDVRERLAEMYARVPVIVAERVESESGQIKTERELISQEELAGMPEFWTIESRMVDYLGFISRDLGKELSVNEFLATLAPELRDPRITPVISDAHHFKDAILSSHTVAQVEFSRKNQQTLIHWQPRGNQAGDVDFSTIRDELERVFDMLWERDELDFLEETTKHRLGYSRPRTFITQIVSGQCYKGMIIAPVKGDVEGTQGICTRIVVVVDPDSPAAQTWITLTEPVVKQSPIDMQLENLGVLSAGVVTFLRLCEDVSERGRPVREVSKAWRMAARKLNAILSGMNVDDQLPEEMTDAIGLPDDWFNASRYWWDWEKAGG